MSQQAIIIGGSIAGLASALALAERGFEVTVIERDPPPPASLAPAQSQTWRRRGAPHAAQPHVLTAKLTQTLKAWQPGLIEVLRAAGGGELGFADMIHPAARRYRPAAGDEEIDILLARRTTLELVMRRYVEAQGAARMLAGARAMSLLIEHGSGPPRVRGVRAEDETGVHELVADLVVDASGRGGRIAEDLAAAGIKVGEEHHVSSSAYFTRHYRLRPGKTGPGLFGVPGAIFADFTAGIFPADNGALTVTVAVFKDDPLLFGVLGDERVFDALCNAVPMVAAWIDPDVAEPTSPVMSWANMDFMWRTLLQDGQPRVLGFYFAGDTALRSNPKYGRGCTCAVLGARLLADSLAATQDDADRLRRYETALRQAFRHEWEELLGVDRADRDRFQRAVGLAPRSPASRLRSAFQDHLLQRAALLDPAVQRALLRGFYGLEPPSAWTRRPAAWARIARAAFLSAPQRAVAGARAARPSRTQIADLITAATQPALQTEGAA